MESLKENINSGNQANNQNLMDEKLRKMHTGDLGLELPDDYFSKSKNEILAKVTNQNKGRVIPLFKNKVFWAVAAAIALLIVFTLVKTSTLPRIDELPTIVSDTIEQLNTKGLTNEGFEDHKGDILVTSLFIDDKDIDEFVDNYMMEQDLFDEIDLK